MRRLRCPRCQAVNYEGHITYPICHKCHENLQKCLYCLNFPGELDRCRFLPDWSLAGGEQVVECDYRNSKLHIGEPQITRYSRPLRSVMVLSVIVCSIIALLVSVLPMLSGPQEHGHSLIFMGYIPRENTLQDMITTSFVIFNDDATFPEDFRIRFDDRIFAHFRMVNITPPPNRIASLNAARYYIYMGLGPKERMDLRFQLRSFRTGSVDFEVSLYSAEGSLLTSPILRKVLVRAPVTSETPTGG